MMTHLELEKMRAKCGNELWSVIVLSRALSRGGGRGGLVLVPLKTIFVGWLECLCWCYCPLICASICQPVYIYIYWVSVSRPPFGRSDTSLVEHGVPKLLFRSGLTFVSVFVSVDKLNLPYFTCTILLERWTFLFIGFCSDKTWLHRDGRGWQKAGLAGAQHLGGSDEALRFVMWPFYRKSPPESASDIQHATKCKMTAQYHWTRTASVA